MFNLKQNQFKSEMATYLQYGEVFQYAVHHVFFRQLFELVNKVYHVFTHWRSVNAVYKPAVFIVTKLRLQKIIITKDLKAHLLHKSQKVATLPFGMYNTTQYSKLPLANRKILSVCLRTGGSL